MKNNNDTLSVIIITHNRIDLLKEALASVYAQTILPEEIIVVDDGSSFSVEKKLKYDKQFYSNIPIKFIRLEDLGPSCARNAGAKIANGNILIFLDDDDLWHKQYIEKTVNLLKNTNHEVIITWQDSWLNGNIVSAVDKHCPKNIVELDLFKKNYGITGSNIIIRKNAFNKIQGFDTQLLASEDKDFIIRLVQNNISIRVLAEPLVYHRIHNKAQLSDPTDFNSFKIKGKERFLAKYSQQMTVSTYNFLSGQLDLIYFLSKTPLKLKLKGLILMIKSHPAFLIDLFKIPINILIKKIS